MSIVLLSGIIGEKNHFEVVTSQTHLFSGSQLESSKFSNLNNFLVYSSICMKFAPNILVLEIPSCDYGFTVSDPFPLIKILHHYHEAQSTFSILADKIFPGKRYYQPLILKRKPAVSQTQTKFKPKTFFRRVICP